MNNKQDILIDEDRFVTNDEHCFLNKTLNNNQKDRILMALKQNAGHLTRTALRLGISRPSLWRKMKEFENDFLKRAINDYQKVKTLVALKQNASNRTHTAQQLGISRTTLWRRMKKFEI